MHWEMWFTSINVSWCDAQVEDTYKHNVCTELNHKDNLSQHQNFSFRASMYKLYFPYCNCLNMFQHVQNTCVHVWACYSECQSLPICTLSFDLTELKMNRSWRDLPSRGIHHPKFNFFIFFILLLFVKVSGETMLQKYETMSGCSYGIISLIRLF